MEKSNKPLQKKTPAGNFIKLSPLESQKETDVIFIGIHWITSLEQKEGFCIVRSMDAKEHQVRETADSILKRMEEVINNRYFTTWNY
jgi:hypothetical protein